MVKPRTLSLLTIVILIIGGLCAAVLIWPSIDSAFKPSGMGQGVFATAPVWTFEAPDPLIASPVTDAGTVFLHTTEDIYALDTSDGHLLWKMNSPGDARFTGPPVIFNSTLFVPEGNARIAAFSIPEGRRMWNACPTSDPCVAGGYDRPVNSTAFLDDTLFVTRFNWDLSAYGMTDGQVKWEADIPGRESVDVVGYDHKVYTTGSGHLIAHDASTGTIVWDQDLEAIIGHVALDGDTLYAILYNSTGSSAWLLAFNLKSRDEVWKVPLDKQQFNTNDFVGVSGDSVLVARDYVVALAKDSGEIRWKTKEVMALQRPIFYDSSVLVRTDGSTLYDIDITHGNLLGTLDLHNNVPMGFSTELNPAVAGDLIVVPMGARWVYAYRAKN